MKRVKVKIETSVETMLGDKPVNEFLSDVADICHTSLEYSDYRNDMADRVTVLEGAICRILDLLED